MESVVVSSVVRVRRRWDHLTPPRFLCKTAEVLGGKLIRHRKLGRASGWSFYEEIWNEILINDKQDIYFVIFN